MRFSELKRLRKEANGGRVAADVVKLLKLPMPDDVLEQFVIDHGRNEIFQLQYGGLDLHAVDWRQESVPAVELLDCSVSSYFADDVHMQADSSKSLTKMNAVKGVIRHWQKHGTWDRPPVLVRGSLVASDKRLHLVEGHTRVGTLRGLVQNGAIPRISLHKTWIGEAKEPSDDGEWKEVILDHFLPFIDWLIEHRGDPGEMGEIAALLVEARYYKKIREDQLDDFLASVAKDTKKGLADTINAAFQKWQAFIKGE